MTFQEAFLRAPPREKSHRLSAGDEIIQAITLSPDGIFRCDLTADEICISSHPQIVVSRYLTTMQNNNQLRIRP